MGTIINCDCSRGAFDITMISAVTATNGRSVTIRHIGTDCTVGIVTVSSQTITLPTTGVTTTAFELTGYGESVTLVSDGSNWHVTQHTPRFLRLNAPRVIIIADRVTSAPASSPGRRYIVQTGFSTFETHDIIEDNGQGGFIEITPPADCGWIAYVQDEDAYYHFIGSAWVSHLSHLDGLVTRGSLIAIIEDQKAQNTAAQALSSGSDQVRVLNTLAYNRDTLVSLSSNRFTLPAGTWEIEWVAPAGTVGLHQAFLYNQSDGTEVARGSSGFSDRESGITVDIQGGPSISIGRAVVTIASAKSFEIRHRVAVTGTQPAANFGTEVYTRVTLRGA